MNRRGTGDFPWGSGSGGDKDIFGQRKYFLFTWDDENPENNAENEIFNNGNGPQRSLLTIEINLEDFLTGDLNVSRHEHCCDSAGSFSDPDFEGYVRCCRFNHEANGAYPRTHNYTTYIGLSCFGFPNAHAGYGFARFVGALLLEQGGVTIGFHGRLGISTGDFHGVGPCNQVDSGASVQGQGFDARFGEIYDGERDGNQHLNHIDNAPIFNYSTTTVYALRTFNGETLSDMLSLRDSHIFNLMNAINYSGQINQICINQHLVEAMINHLDCLQAMMARNLSLALMKQIACVNAVMRLLNEPYRMNEEWTYPVIQTVIYELQIISNRAESAGYRGRVVIRYDWAVTDPACYFHPDDCQCQQGAVYPSRTFYRRS